MLISLIIVFRRTVELKKGTLISSPFLPKLLTDDAHIDPQDEQFSSFIYVFIEYLLHPRLCLSVGDGEPPDVAFCWPRTPFVEIRYELGCSRHTRHES